MEPKYDEKTSKFPKKDHVGNLIYSATVKIVTEVIRVYCATYANFFTEDHLDKIAPLIIKKFKIHDDDLSFIFKVNIQLGSLTKVISCLKDLNL
jgi:hypothetical protein